MHYRVKAAKIIVTKRFVQSADCIIALDWITNVIVHIRLRRNTASPRCGDRCIASCYVYALCAACVDLADSAHSIIQVCGYNAISKSCLIVSTFIVSGAEGFPV
jgi:hypothetical protein